MNTPNTKYTPRALSFIADRSQDVPQVPTYIINGPDGDELCRVFAVNAHAAVGLALSRRDLRFYLRRDLSAVEVATV